MNKQNINKCSFCSYKTVTGCTVTPNSYYCKKANDEYYQYIKGNQQQKPVRSLRSWERK